MSSIFPDSDGATERLSGTVERVTFHSADSGFTVLKVKVKGRRDLATVVGHSSGAGVGEKIEASGRWVEDRTRGLQFKADALATSAPTGASGIARFLGSGAVPGVGPVTAERIVKAYGKRAFEVIENEPKRLMEDLGLRPATVEKIVAGWRETRALREVMVFLSDHGIGTERAARIAKAYGPSAQQIMASDPYRLARDIRGIGFPGADEIAAKLGIGRDSPARLRAGVVHVVETAAGQGHTGLPRADVAERAERLLGVDGALIDTAIATAVDHRDLVPAEIEGTDCLLHRVLDEAEQVIADRLKALGRGAPPWPTVDHEAVVANAERATGLMLSASQREALGLVAGAKVSVITGGPGVGKTTLLDSLLKLLAASGMRTALAAPTGRAARRMSDQTGLEAKTIHRLLEIDPLSGTFKRGTGKPLDCDVLVVDETSMVDVPLMASLLQALSDEAALVLVGDVDQLPSVGPGQVLADIIRSGLVPVARLTEIFRQAAESRIITGAHAINRGELPDLAASEGSDLFFVGMRSPEDGIAKIVEIVSNRIPRRFGLDPMRDVQVLTPMNRGALGTRSLNTALQAVLNPAPVERIERFGTVFSTGDRIMQTENDYDREVFNGDLGLIEAIDVKGARLMARFDGREVAYPFTELDTLVPAFATTIHKAQGSEYPAVVVVASREHRGMLDRKLVYTGVTRGKSLVVIVGDQHALAEAVSEGRTRKRWSRLYQRLVG
jgi:exodeoxyribonuclease V alpha subunit